MNLDLAKRIKALRAQKGFSQEELANETNLSIRTIQRIEGGETEARGDTLKRLANVLDVTPNDLVTWIEHEDRGYIAFLNLSAMSYIAFPLLNVIVPLALWILKRDKIKDMNEIGKRLVNFQITWCILIGFFYVSFMVIKIFHVDVRIPHFGLRTFMNIGITD
jgi:transcriptional regulator with XRE-family HTH domain